MAHLRAARCSGSILPSLPARRLRSLLLGAASAARPPLLPAGAPGLLVELASQRLPCDEGAPGASGGVGGVAGRGAPRRPSRPMLAPLHDVFGATPPWQQYALAKVGGKGRLVCVWGEGGVGR